METLTHTLELGQEGIVSLYTMYEFVDQIYCQYMVLELCKHH